MIEVLHVVGARPQFIKVAPVLEAFRRLWPEVRQRVLHTGQHYDYVMSRVFFEEMGLPDPDVHLGVGSGTHAYQTGEMIKGIEREIVSNRPSLVVYGDTNSTLAGALAAAKLHVPVAHVEAGLRSFNKRMPEEINRVLTDHVSDLLFCPTPTAVENLKREGVTHGVHHVGYVMCDAALRFGAVAERTSQILARLRLEPQTYAVLTVHRAENTDDAERLLNICLAVEQLAEELPVIFPVHPRTRKAFERLGRQLRRIRVIDPLPYLDMLMLTKHARAVLTDSGGLQKEAFFFRVPCVTLRDETEWVETLQGGWNRLAGTEPSSILERVHELLTSPPRSEPFNDDPFGGGRASERIIQVVRARYA